jgi:hypothetical protein
MLGTVLPSYALRSLVDMAGHAPPGCFVEVGVYTGGSAWFLQQIATSENRELHLFDTFCGMPTSGEHDPHEIGDMADTDFDMVRDALPDAIFHVGEFPHTLPQYLPPIAFVHVDCDQYDGVIACIDKLLPLMVDGGIMLFDDYEHLEGARLAVNERIPTVGINRWGKAYTVK